MRDTFCLAWDQAHGAKLVDFHGWNMPVSYPKGILYEHEATRTSCGMFNITHMGRLRIEGPQAYKFSNYAFTNDLTLCPIGSALYGFLLNPKGGVIDDVIIYDADGYAPLRDFLKQQGVRHVLLTGYATDMCFCKTTAGYENLSKDFNVFLVGDATLATFPANSTPRYATNAHISFAAIKQFVTQISWVRHRTSVASNQDPKQ